MPASLTQRDNVKYLGLFVLMFLLVLNLGDQLHWIPIVVVFGLGMVQGYQEGRVILRSKDALLAAKMEHEVEEILNTASRRRLYVAYMAVALIATIAAKFTFDGAFQDTATISFFAGVAGHHVGRFPSIVILNQGVQNWNV